MCIGYRSKQQFTSSKLTGRHIRLLGTHTVQTDVARVVDMSVSQFFAVRYKVVFLSRTASQLPGLEFVLVGMSADEATKMCLPIAAQESICSTPGHDASCSDES